MRAITMYPFPDAMVINSSQETLFVCLSYKTSMKFWCIRRDEYAAVLLSRPDLL